MVYNLTGNITNVPELIYQVSRELPIVAPLMTVFIWLVISFGGMMSAEKQYSERKGAAMWFSIGGLFTNIILLILFMITPGFISLYLVVTSITIFLLIALWWIVGESMK